MTLQRGSTGKTLFHLWLFAATGLAVNRRARLVSLAVQVPGGNGVVQNDELCQFHLYGRAHKLSCR